MDRWFDLPEPNASAWVSQISGAADFGSVAVDHVGIAVADLDDAIDQFRSWFGAGNWAVSTFAIEATYGELSGMIGGRTAITSFGPISVELVEPTQGSWTAVDVLASEEGGLYHVGLRVADVGLALEGSIRAGMTTELLAVHDGVPLFAYVTDASSRLRLEFIGSRYPTDMITAAEIVE
jgi:hypothetical protein